MAKSNGTKQSSNDQLLLLRKEQNQIREGSLKWVELQDKINQIIAEKFLQYVNR